MLFITNNCKHCGKTYNYQASGEGCFNKFNDKDYCPTCKKAIIDALNNIPIRYVEKWKLISDVNYEELEELKKNYINKFNIAKIVSLNNKNNDYVEQFIKNSHLFQVEWNTNNPSLKEIYCMYSYDIVEKCFTNDRWVYMDENPSFINCCYYNFKEFGEKISTKPLKEPVGDLYYEEWDVIFNK